MTSAHNTQLRLISLGALAGFLVLLLAVNVPAVLAADYYLEWSSIGFAEGVSTLQTFTDVNGSGVDITTEFHVLDADFNNLGHYVPGTTSANQGMPKPNGGNLAVRDINVSQFPGNDVGYILTEITFSQPVNISGLWLEAFFHWEPSDENVRKHLALQAFDENGNAVVPVDWTITGGDSELIVAAHPDNGQQWLRSNYADGQSTHTGAIDIDYGSQTITELHWYSWGYEDDDTLSHLLGSTYLGDFTFSTVPTAITLVSAEVAADFGAAGIILPALVLAGVTVFVILRRRLIGLS